MTRVLACGFAALVAFGGPEVRPAEPRQNGGSGLDQAQYQFFSGNYELAAAEAAPMRQPGPLALAAYELRTSALHFRIKELLGSAPNKDKAFKQCTACPTLLKAFGDDAVAGRALATAQLVSKPGNETLLYFQAKLDLNEVWLNNSTLERRVGFGKYRDARKTVEAILKVNPKHVRARVAHAWIDYAVASRIPFGFKWVFGGGDRKRGLANMRAAAKASTDRFEAAEAWFGLWEMLVLEKQTAEALDVARRLATDFPQNQRLQRFIASGGK